MSKRRQREPSKDAVQLAEHITKFVNAAFGRKLGRLGPSRNLIDAIDTAMEAGYTRDEIRIVFWAARCTTNSWIGTALAAKAQPELVLRHSGGMNTITGKPAKRWLDDLLDEVGEINSNLARAILRSLPEEMRAEELKLLQEAEIITDE